MCRKWKCKCFPVPVTKDQLRATFRHFDQDGDGLLSKKELAEAFKYLGSLAPGWRADLAVLHADQNGDGYINADELEELVNYASKRNYKYH